MLIRSERTALFGNIMLLTEIINRVMKNFILTSALFLIGALINTTSADQREGTILYALMGVTDYLHFSPKAIDDELSVEIFDDYIKLLDESKRFFLQSEIDRLKQYKKEIDNQINDFDFEFFEVSEEMTIDAIARAKVIYEAIIEKEIPQGEGTYETDGNKKVFAGSLDELYVEWEQLIQYTIVGKMYDYDDDETTSEELRKKATMKTKELFDDWFTRMSKVTHADRFERYMNTIMGQFDPHSTYFSPKEQENFEMQMSNKLEGIGAQLLQDGDFVKVVSIVPGGPAWKGEELQSDDVIIEVQQLGAEPVDIAGMRLDDVIRMIRGDKGTTVILKVKRKGGITKSISIVRDEIILEDALAKSAVLSVENQVENIGYINLPLFYGTFEGGKSCAADVDQEIEKLRKEKVKGIILDLRYNRGGSLQDAIDMAGLFIEKGAIIQVSDNQGRTEVYKDENSNVSYDGPLIVLVNGVSASSSEIVAGALQDYKRAVVIGGPKTYGKGTVQGLFDLDRMIQDDNGMKPLGQVKLTTQKFFRVSGKSNQLQGIVPDVIIPDEFHAIDYGENEYEDALPYSEIESINYSQSVYVTKKVAELKSKSFERISTSDKFQRVKEYSKLLAEQDDDTQVSLDYANYELELDKSREKLEKFEDIFEEAAEGLIAKNASADQEYIDEFESRQVKNQRFLENLINDIQLRESLMVMKDMIAVDNRLAKK